MHWISPALRSLTPLAILLICQLCPLALADEPTERYFRIQVIDSQTDRGVPLVQLKTVNDISYWTDSAGLIAFHEPGLMGQKVFFHVASHGYEYPTDGFGFRGIRLEVESGGKAVVKLQRKNIAERLYRTTGGGIYRDTMLLGDQPPVSRPLLNAQVLGSDTIMSAVYRGQIYWFWGDTNRPSYPLGNFHIPGATSQLPTAGGLDPAKGIELSYFTDAAGFAAETCRMPGDGPTWIDGLAVLGEGEDQRMLASYVKVKPPLTAYARGLVEFNPQTNRFEQQSTFPLEAPLYPMGHPLTHSVAGTRYLYFPKPMPWVRVKATAEAYLDLSQYEAYTCFKQGSTESDFQFDRTEQGALRWRWRTNTLPMTHDLERKLIRQGKLSREDAALQLTDAQTGKLVSVHSSSIEWNAYRQRWTMIALEENGTSPLGEIWYAEAEELAGPWSAARKIVTHENYTFYNPKQHPMFAEQGGKIIYFEGTYTAMFSGNPQQTPRYEYNQVMYRLDLSEQRLQLE